MRIVPDVIVIHEVAYVHLQLPAAVPLGLMLSRGLGRLLSALPGAELYQIAAEKDGQALILGFEAQSYDDLLDEMEVTEDLSTVVPLGTLRDDEDLAFVVTEAPLDGPAHLFAVCSAFAARNPQPGGRVAGVGVLEVRGEGQSAPNPGRVLA